MKKKLLCTFLCIATAVSFCGCKNQSTILPELPSEATEADSGAEKIQTTFTRSNFPRMDGSTSLVPLGQGIASVLLGESRESASDLISFNKTTQSFRNLCWGDCDIVIAAEPKADVFEEMKENNFEYEMETIAKEALVFVVNENNPVDSLTIAQLQDIYSGKITNWKEVGGKDEKIAAFQRNAGAGSQVMMEKLVMAGKTMMEPPKEYIEEEMGGLIEAVKSYDNTANAIGYTVYYYADDMKVASGLKIISVDGVMAEPDSIRSEKYPFINGYYCCIAKNATSDSTARLMYDWLVSEAGQELLNLEGYVSVFEKGKAKSKGDNIVIDSSKYVPFGAPEKKYTRLANGALDKLEPSDNYGLILPYTGEIAYTEYDDQSCKMGFCTEKGEIITDPIYSYIGVGGFTNKDYKPVWICTKRVSEEGGIAEEVRTFVSLDGSVVCDRDYAYMYTSGNFIFAEDFQDGESHSTIYDHNGKLICRADDVSVLGEKVEISDAMGNGFIAHSFYKENMDMEYFLLDNELNMRFGGFSYLSFLDENYLIGSYADGSDSLLNMEGECLFIGGQYNFDSLYKQGKLLVVGFQNGEYGLCTLDGKVLHRGAKYYEEENGVLYAQTPLAKSVEVVVFKEDGSVECKGEIPSDDPESTYVLYTGVEDVFYTESYSDFTSTTFYKLASGQSKTCKDTAVIYGGEVAEKYFTANYYDGVHNQYYTQVYDSRLNIVQSVKSCQTLHDSIADRDYYTVGSAYGFNGSSAIYEKDFEKLFTVNGNVTVYNGYFVATSEYGCSCYDGNGNVVFCYPFYGSASGD